MHHLGDSPETDLSSCNNRQKSSPIRLGHFTWENRTRSSAVRSFRNCTKWSDGDRIYRIDSVGTDFDSSENSPLSFTVWAEPFWVNADSCYPITSLTVALRYVTKCRLYIICRIQKIRKYDWHEFKIPILHVRARITIVQYANLKSLHCEATGLQRLVWRRLWHLGC